MALNERNSAPATLWTLPTASGLISIWFLPPILRNVCWRKWHTAWTLFTHHLRLYHSLATVDGQQAANLDGSLTAQATNDCVCRACGCGDTIGHWTRWCPIPLIVAHAILRPAYQHSTLNSIALMTPRNTAICTFILARFRRLLREEGAFLHQNKADAKPSSWWVQQLHLEAAKDAHFELNVPVPILQSSHPVCMVDTSKLDLQRSLAPHIRYAPHSAFGYCCHN